MKLAIMQPYFFPYIGYFQLLNAVDKYVFYDDVNFTKQGWINRNRILIAGKPCFITVPLKNASSFVPIHNVQIVDPGKSNWKSKWLKTLQQSYGKAPYFAEVFPLVEAVIQLEITSISQLAIHSVKTICHYLQIHTVLVDSSSQYKNNHLRAEERVLDICQQESCSQYINAIGGMELYCRETFKSKNIQLNFLQSGEIQYTHFSATFTPWLSIIDVLMHNSKDQVAKFLCEYKLV